MKKNGFTLVEIIAIIAILGVILSITIPGITKLLDGSSKKAFESDAGMFIKTVNLKKMDDKSFDETSLDVTNISNVLDVSSNDYQAVSVSELKGGPYVVLLGKNKWNNLVAYGTFDNIKVEDSSNYDRIMRQLGYDEEKGANEPKLVKGMMPIKWDGKAWVDTTEDDPKWYNYNTTDKEWANARTVDGSMWVWIPRYIYKIRSGWHTNTAGTIDIQFSKGLDDNWNNASIGNIDTGTTSNASNNKWTNHPAFTFDSTELTGIWVAKFEATASEGVANGNNDPNGFCPIVGDDVTTKTVKILPNVRPWICIDVGRAFTVSRNMEANSIYGWTTANTLKADGTYTTDANNIDTHLMKNIEWGAVAYLSKSVYGKNTAEVYANNSYNINNNQNYGTGCAGNTVSASKYNGCQNTYETTNGVKASTTGNVYGIYDLSGGVNELISSYVDSGDNDLTVWGPSIINANSKYKDVYTVGNPNNNANNYALAINKKGDALYETSNGGDSSNTSWFGDWAYMTYPTQPLLVRGGDFGATSNAGVFGFLAFSGQYHAAVGFRPVLLVNTGL